MTNLRFLVEASVRDVGIILHRSQVPSAIIAQVRQRLTTLLAMTAEHTAFSQEQQQPDPQVFCREIAYELADYVSSTLAPSRRVEKLEAINVDQRNHISRLEATVRDHESKMLAATATLKRFQSAHTLALEALFKEIHILRQRNLASEEKIHRVNSEAIFDYRKYLSSLLSDQEDTVMKIFSLQEETNKKTDQIDGLCALLTATEERMAEALREANSTAGDRVKGMAGHLKGIERALGLAMGAAKEDMATIKQQLMATQEEHTRNMLVASEAVGTVTLGNTLLQDFVLRICDYLVALCDDEYAALKGEEARDNTSRLLAIANGTAEAEKATKATPPSGSGALVPATGAAEGSAWKPLRQSLTAADMALLTPALVSEYRDFARQQFQEALVINPATDNGSVRKIKLMLRQGPVSSKGVETILSVRRMQQENAALHENIHRMAAKVTEMQLSLLQSQQNAYRLQDDLRSLRSSGGGRSADAVGGGGGTYMNGDAPLVVANTNGGAVYVPSLDKVVSVGPPQLTEFRDVSGAFSGGSGADGGAADRAAASGVATPPPPHPPLPLPIPPPSDDTFPMSEALALSRSTNREGRQLLHKLFAMAVEQHEAAQQQLKCSRAGGGEAAVNGNEGEGGPLTALSPPPTPPPSPSPFFTGRELALVLDARNRHMHLATVRNRLAYKRITGRVRTAQLAESYRREMTVWLRVAEGRDAATCEADTFLPWLVKGAPRVVNSVAEPSASTTAVTMTNSNAQQQQQQHRNRSTTSHDALSCSGSSKLSSRTSSTAALGAASSLPPHHQSAATEARMAAIDAKKQNFIPLTVADAMARAGNNNSNSNSSGGALPTVRQASWEFIQQGTARLLEGQRDREASSVEQCRHLTAGMDRNALDLFAALGREAVTKAQGLAYVPLKSLLAAQRAKNGRSALRSTFGGNMRGGGGPSSPLGRFKSVVRFVSAATRWQSVTRKSLAGDGDDANANANGCSATSAAEGSMRAHKDRQKIRLGDPMSVGGSVGGVGGKAAGVGSSTTVGASSPRNASANARGRQARGQLHPPHRPASPSKGIPMNGPSEGRREGRPQSPPSPPSSPIATFRPATNLAVVSPTIGRAMAMRELEHSLQHGGGLLGGGPIGLVSTPTAASRGHHGGGAFLGGDGYDPLLVDPNNNPSVEGGPVMLMGGGGGGDGAANTFCRNNNTQYAQNRAMRNAERWYGLQGGNGAVWEDWQQQQYGVDKPSAPAGGQQYSSAFTATMGGGLAPSQLRSTSPTTRVGWEAERSGGPTSTSPGTSTILPTIHRGPVGGGSGAGSASYAHSTAGGPPAHMGTDHYVVNGGAGAAAGRVVGFSGQSVTSRLQQTFDPRWYSTSNNGDGGDATHTGGDGGGGEPFMSIRSLEPPKCIAIPATGGLADRDIRQRSLVLLTMTSLLGGVAGGTATISATAVATITGAMVREPINGIATPISNKHRVGSAKGPRVMSASVHSSRGGDGGVNISGESPRRVGSARAANAPKGAPMAPPRPSTAAAALAAKKHHQQHNAELTPDIPTASSVTMSADAPPTTSLSSAMNGARSRPPSAPYLVLAKEGEGGATSSAGAAGAAGPKHRKGRLSAAPTVGGPAPPQGLGLASLAIGNREGSGAAVAQQLGTTRPHQSIPPPLTAASVPRGTSDGDALTAKEALPSAEPAPPAGIDLRVPTSAPPAAAVASASAAAVAVVDKRSISGYSSTDPRKAVPNVITAAKRMKEERSYGNGAENANAFNSSNSAAPSGGMPLPAGVSPRGAPVPTAASSARFGTPSYSGINTGSRRPVAGTPYVPQPPTQPTSANTLRYQ